MLEIGQASEIGQQRSSSPGILSYAAFHVDFPRGASTAHSIAAISA
jgi:hypothetical protein